MDLSVVMAVHNQAKKLESALASIGDQSYKDWLFFIVDDGSTDQTPAILKRWQYKDKRFRIITNNDQIGLTKSLNKALRQVKTKLIARMDGDDIALPERLEKQRKFMLSHPKIGLLGTAVNLIDNQGRQLKTKLMPENPEQVRKVVLSYCPLIHPTWMIRKSVLDRIGHYNESFPYAQDYELILRIAAKFSVANLAKPLLNYRVNSDSAISLKRLKQQELLALKARFLALMSYGYPWAESWRLLKPGLSFLIPAGIKKLVYQRFFWR